ncbi:DNA-binding transcriptional LysR family regulator [Chitinivorax tropicus]|uniref:DNA-binding transcriptional LysR family regulator n=1 Tax=Chitinivorax tropicus TaxID=714531 RepID=A0A840MGG7_9PROT|nr:LysR family transcriptional regulator [Chitinivorax tropicus]MBB5017738.1 DNA-binding transcriptional LysR family regulator [Chitinivorax tropicus]
MKISFRHIEVFRAVMTAGSVTGAATLLSTSQPTISRELARLEQLLQLQLFERVKGRLIPTTQALSLFDEVQRAYGGLERVVSKAQSLRHFEQGQLSIAALPVFAQTLLPLACRAFNDQFPHVSLTITPEESPLLEESLSAQQHDLGLSEQATTPPGTAQHGILTADMVCILPEGHRLLDRACLAPSDFHKEPFISLSGFDVYRQRLDSLFLEHQVERRMLIQTTSAASVCAMVREGLGVAIVNPLTAFCELGQRIQVRPFSLSVPFQVCSVRPLHRPPSALADAFAATLLKTARQLQQRIQQQFSPAG